MTKNKAYILMDVGGTFIKSGLTTVDGNLIEGTQNTVGIDSDGSKEEIINSLTAAVRQGIELTDNQNYTLAGVGICMPGPFNYFTGVSKMVHKFKAIFDLSLMDLIHEIEELDQIPVVFGHDVNTQLLGEMTGGNAKGEKNVCLVSLGTGLGFAMAKEGKVLMNDLGSPAISIWNRPYGDRILEDFASKRGFYNTWEMVTGNKPDESLTVERMGGMAAEGDETALEVFRRVGEFIGKTIRPILAEQQTACLLFGGQISRSFRFMEKAVRHELDGLPDLKIITTVSDFSNAAFKGLADMIKKA